MDMKFKKAAIIGVGLMGGSLARSIKKHGLAEKIAGSGRSEENLKTALELGIIDEIATAESAVKDADLIFLCTPALSIIPTLKKIAPHIKGGAIVTDVGSVKGSIVKDAEAIAGNFSFVGSHPICGTEKSGASASFDTLYDGQRCIVTPTTATPDEAIDTVKKFWEAIGMNVEVIDPETHDRIMAAVSHLPHLVVYALVNTVSNEESEGDLIKFAAGGFKDFTRIASSPPEMWADILLGNSDAVCDLTQKIKEQLGLIESAIKNGEREKLLEIFGKSNAFRKLLK